MLDFRKALKHREGLGPKQYRPLVAMIFLLGIAAIIADNARQPSFWAVLDRAASPSPAPPAGEIDRRSDAARQKRASIPDSFLMSAEGPRERGGGGPSGVEPGRPRATHDDGPPLRLAETRWIPLVAVVAAALVLFTAWGVSLGARPPRVLPEQPPDFTQLRLEGEGPKGPRAEGRKDPT
jgi:hypothetical protein